MTACLQTNTISSQACLHYKENELSANNYMPLTVVSVLHPSTILKTPVDEASVSDNTDMEILNAVLRILKATHR